MRPAWTKTGLAFAVASGAMIALAGCDTNYYGSGETSRSTTTTTTAAPPPPASSTTTTVTPGYDGSSTTTERTYRRY